MKLVQIAWPLLVLALGACGSDDDDDAATQGSARDRATRATCDKLAECGQIGEGQNYETRESCDIDQRANWERTWPPSQCDGAINQSALDDCLVTIDAAQCGNALDLLNILANKCAQATVCSG